MKKIRKNGYLRIRVYALAIVIFAALWFAAMNVTHLLYSKSLEERYVDLSKTAAQTVCGFITVDETERYINGFDTTKYIQANNKIRKLDANMSDIYSIGVYKMRSNTMDVMFDTKSDKLRGGLGSYKQYDRNWGKYRENFFAGETVERMIANEAEGTVIYYCTPIGEPVDDVYTYVCVGVTQSLINHEETYLLKRNAVSLAFAILVVFFIVAFFIERQIVAPLKNVNALMKKAADKTSNPKLIQKIMDKNIRSGNEIDEIYNALGKIYTSKVRLSTAMSRAKNSNTTALTALMNRMDNFCASHLDNTLQYAITFASELCKTDKYRPLISDKDYSDFMLAVPLHDVGKLLMPRGILNKPGRLTPEEKQAMNEHTIYGAEIIDKMSIGTPDESYLKLARELALSHHEEWSGNGYPNGLKGEEIPLLVRVMQITDVLDALLSERGYKPAIPFDEAFEMVVSQRGKKFDPDLIDELIKIKPQLREIYNKTGKNVK